MIDRCLRAFACILFVAAVCALAACASEPEQKDQQLRKAQKAKPAAEVEEPSPEELANTPCGNPDWAQLPAGAEAKSSDEQPEQQNAPAGGENDEDGENGAEDSAKQSNKAALSAIDQPCT